jgi:dolichol-phosphate mannosyltransferase
MVLIPSCHNTEQLLGVLAKFNQVNVDSICIITDCAYGSELDQLQNSIEALKIPVHLINQPTRKGVGFAIRAGIKYAIDQKRDFVVVMAGNGKDQPNEIPRLLKPIVDDGYDYVQGSRFLPGGKHVKNPFFRLIFSQVYPYLWTMLTKTRCTDVTNGFRAYKLSIFKNHQINIRQSWLNDYQLEYYIHYKALTLGYKTKEVPVSKIYPFKNKGGYSNIQPLKDWWKIVSPLIYLKFGVKK